ncbi:MAG TPA: hypothetical protein VFS17_05495 [Methylophilaceae bacterium]|nr:hypothetical protein [Methylophilaceae bacterium]
MSDATEKIIQAEHKIAAILADLEKETGMLVDSISMSTIEITRIESLGREYQCKVDISMLRLPGHDWTI